MYGGLLAIIAIFTVQLTASEAESSAKPATPAPAATGDSSTQRLLAMQRSLQTALTELNRAHPDPHRDGFLDDAISDVNKALINVAKGLEYVKAHPESDKLIARSARAGWPVMPIKNGYGIVDMPAIKSTYPTLSPAQDALSLCLPKFLIGESTDGYRVMNDLGGYRDIILRCADTGLANLVKGVMAHERSGNPRYAGQPPPPSPITHTTNDQGGSISGKVLDSRGQPAAYAAISIHLAEELGDRALAMGDPNSAVFDGMAFAGGILVSVTDQNGDFIIRDLPPGSYAVTAELTNGGDTQTITHRPMQVKAGEETKFAQPVTLFNMHRGFGG